VTAGYISSNPARIFFTRAFRSAAVLGLTTRILIEVNVALGRRFVGILFGDL